MKQSTSIIKIDDVIAIKYKKDTKYYQLMDIAVWVETGKIFTCDFMKLKLPYCPTKEESDYYKKITKKPDHVIQDRELFLVQYGKCLHPYQVCCYIRSDTPNIIHSLNFRKMIAT